MDRDRDLVGKIREMAMTTGPGEMRILEVAWDFLFGGILWFNSNVLIRWIDFYCYLGQLRRRMYPRLYPGAQVMNFCEFSSWNYLEVVNFSISFSRIWVEPLLGVNITSLESLHWAILQPKNCKAGSSTSIKNFHVVIVLQEPQVKASKTKSTLSNIDASASTVR